MADNVVVSITYDDAGVQAAASRISAANEQIVAGATKVSSATTQVTETQRRLAPATTGSAEAFVRLQRSLDPVATAHAKLEKAARDADAAISRGRATVLDKERALSALHAKVLPAAEGLTRFGSAADAVRGSLSGLASGLGPIGLALEGIGPAGLVAASGIAAIAAGLGVALTNAKEAIDHFGQLHDQAEQLGLSAESFQELTFGFSQIGVKSDQAVVALTKLNDAVGQVMLEGADAPKGIINAFGELNISIEQIQESEGNLDSILKLVADGMQNLGTTAEKTAVAKELLGRRGAALVPILQDGAAGLESMQSAARGAGAVLSNELVASLDNASDRLDQLNQIAEVQSARSFGMFSDVIVEVKGNLIGAWTAVNDLMDALRQSLGKSVADDIVSAFVPVVSTINLAADAYRTLKALIDKSAIAQLAQGINQPNFTTGGGFGGETLTEKSSQALPESINIPKPQVRPEIAGRRAAGGGRGRAGRGGGRASSRAEEELIGNVPLDRLGEFQTELFQFEGDWKDVMASVEREQRRQQDLWEDGVADRLDGLKLQREAFEDSQSPLIEFGENLTSIEGISQGVISGISSIGATATSAFADAIVAGEDFGTTMESLSKTIEKMIIQMTLQMALQQAIGAGAIGLGGLFGGAAAAPGTPGGAPYAKGGIVSADLPYGIYSQPTVFPTETPGFHPMARGMGILAERGPEAVLPLKRTSGGRLGVESSGGGSQTVIVNNYTGAQVNETRKRDSSGDMTVILDLVEQHMAGQAARPGTTLNRALSHAASPLRAR